MADLRSLRAIETVLRSNCERECHDGDEILLALGGIPRTETGRINLPRVLTRITALVDAEAEVARLRAALEMLSEDWFRFENDLPSTHRIYGVCASKLAAALKEATHGR